MHRVATSLILLIATTMLVGCYVERRRTNPWSDLEAIAERQQGGDGWGNEDESLGERATRINAWAILLEEFTGSNATAEAQQRMGYLQTQVRLTGLWLRTEHRRVSLYRGQYTNETLPEAQFDLEQVQKVEIDGERPYENALVVSLAGDGRTALTRWDLRLYPGYYSLQIGVYDSQFGPNYKKAAEDFAESIRRTGKQAYYYHGPNRSMVTVGLFTDDDFELVEGQGNIRVMSYGLAIRELQEQYPHNLLNGRTIIERRPNHPEQTQASFLVRVPE
jgi:hypothetical protein